ncbi:hypothetical protein WA556_000096 [Blastocystis sp. ATCC 50177/Nand II]
MTQGAKGNSAVVAMRKYVHKMTIAKDVKENVQRIEEAVNKITKMLDEGDTEKLVDYLKVFSRSANVVTEKLEFRYISPLVSVLQDKLVDNPRIEIALFAWVRAILCYHGDKLEKSTDLKQCFFKLHKLIESRSSTYEGVGVLLGHTDVLVKMMIEDHPELKSAFALPKGSSK